KGLFKLIRECNLSDNEIYFDKINSTDREELQKLCAVVGAGDIVIVRSIIDLADTPIEIISLLKHFGDAGVDVVAIKEDYYSYKENFNIISDVLLMSIELSEKKRKLGIEKARALGKMGRKSNLEIKNRVYKLKQADFSINEILQICKISRSTYYRILKENNTY
ncbi:recombinase family protein, partial [Aminipila sp.]|uniref:recombinase family protein n=1 Tax=Aminipila sp. TaxID=2060095 RepID=UPI002897FDC6